MRRMLVGIALAFASLATSAGPAGAPVTVQNVPLPVTVQDQPVNVTITNASPLSVTTSDAVEGFKVFWNFNNPPFRPPGGVPSILTPVLYENTSSTTASVNVWLSSQHNGPGLYLCSSPVRATAGEIVIVPPGQNLGPGLFVPMIEYKSVSSLGGVAGEYCWTHAAVAPLYVPPGYKVRVNMIYSADSSVSTPFYVTINGYHMK